MTLDQRLIAFINAIGADMKTALTQYPSAKVFQAFTDCIKATADGYFTYNVTGTGSAISATVNNNQNAMGILTLRLGTVATNRASIDSGNFSIMNLGLGIAFFETDCWFNTLSNDTNKYSFRAGFIDSITTESTDGVFFRYTNDINGGKFQAVTRSNNIETATDTGILATINTWYDFEITTNATATSTFFKINNTLVATINTNIPKGAGRELGYGVYAQRSLGTVSLDPVAIDFIDIKYIFTNYR